jgi:hypothetical protein
MRASSRQREMIFAARVVAVAVAAWEAVDMGNV